MVLSLALDRHRDWCDDCGNHVDECVCHDTGFLIVETDEDGQQMLMREFSGGTREFISCCHRLFDGTIVRCEPSEHGEELLSFAAQLDRRQKFVHLTSGQAQFAEYTCHQHGGAHGHSWKRSSKMRKQWARHAHRVLENTKFTNPRSKKYRSLQRAREAYLHARVVAHMKFIPEYFDLVKQGLYHQAYACAKQDLLQDLLEQQAQQDQFMQMLQGVLQEYNQLRVDWWWFDVGVHELQWLQEEYEPHDLDDVQVTEENSDFYGDRRRTKVLSMIEQLNRKVCFRKDAFEDPENDENEFAEMRDWEETQIRHAA